MQIPSLWNFSGHAHTSSHHTKHSTHSYWPSYITFNFLSDVTINISWPTSQLINGDNHTLLQRFSGWLTKIHSRNWHMHESMAYWNKLCTWSPSQSTVCSSLDRCRAYLQAGCLHVDGEGTYCALSRQCACTKILNGSWSSNLKTSLCEYGGEGLGDLVSCSYIRKTEGR